MRFLKKQIWWSVFLVIFFVTFFLVSFLDPLRPATIPTLGFQNDFVILQDYLESGRWLTGWIFTMNKYEILNQQYGNILSYFELPANSFWQIVSLKGPWKILLKAPIFLFTESFFPTVWKFLWWFLCCNVNDEEELDYNDDDENWDDLSDCIFWRWLIGVKKIWDYCCHDEE